jgi:hypothetical protein
MRRPPATTPQRLLTPTSSPEWRSSGPPSKEPWLRVLVHFLRFAWPATTKDDATREMLRFFRDHVAAGSDVKGGK